MSTNGRADQQNVASPYSGTSLGYKKRSEVLSQRHGVDDLKNVMLNIRSQTQRVTYCTIAFPWNIRIGKSAETECRLVAAGGAWGAGVLGEMGSDR